MLDIRWGQMTAFKVANCLWIEITLPELVCACYDLTVTVMLDLQCCLMSLSIRVSICLVDRNKLEESNWYLLAVISFGLRSSSVTRIHGHAWPILLLYVTFSLVTPAIMNQIN